MRHLGTYLGFLLLIGILLRLDFIFFIVYVMIGLWLLARYGFRRGIQNLTWERNYLDHAFLGDKAEVEIALNNGGWLPLPWLRISDSAPVNLFGGAQVQQLASLRRSERFSFRYALDCNRRGYYTLGPIHVAGGDLLGFLETTYQFSDPAHLTVYPKILSLSELGLDSRQPFGTLRSQQRLFEDPARLSGVRQYQTGDSIRSIHWKASAHADRLLVKKVDPAIALESAILLNLNRDDYPKQTWHATSEWSIVLAASLAYHLSQAGQAVGLSVNGIDPHQADERPRPLPPHSGHAHLMQILEVLARVSVAPTPDFGNWLNRATLDLSWGTTLLVISPQADDALTAALHQQTRRGFNIVLLATQPYGHFGKISARARHLGLTALNITDDFELKQWTQGKSATNFTN